MKVERSACSAMVVVFAMTACSQPPADTPASDSAVPLIQASNTVVPVAESPEAFAAQVARGRHLTITHGCGDCHGGGGNPNAEGYLAGTTSPFQEYRIGPCWIDPAAKPCWLTRPRNITPDNTTGIGRFSERQLFNALRYGLRPGETPDVEITSMVPGEGNHPSNPKYLAPPMPWPVFRHMADQDLWDIVAYLKHGVAPVSNKVEDSEGPPDFWASEYTPEKVGTYPLPAFPAQREQVPAATARR